MQLLIAVTVFAMVFEYAFAIPPVQCSRPRCDRGCQIRIINGPCPECDCGGGDTYGNQRCPPVDNCSGLGCKLERDIRGCQYCACPPSNNQYDRIPQGIQCDPPKCGYNCQIDYTSRPCPSCRCDGSYNNNNNRVQCSPPRCEYPCYLDNNASPCPTCVCNGGGDGFRPAMIQCSPPRCKAPCRLNPYTKPCPSCQC